MFAKFTDILKCKIDDLRYLVRPASNYALSVCTDHIFKARSCFGTSEILQKNIDFYAHSVKKYFVAGILTKYSYFSLHF